jgi:formate/nitrite transporter FocA (FNT family)
MYFIPFGILLKSEPEFTAAIQDGAVVTDTLTLGGFTSNLIPVTLGNIVGGTLFVAGIYWFVYLRQHAWGGTRP